MVAVAGSKTFLADYTALALASSTKPLVRLIQQSAQSMPNGSAAAITFGSGSEDIDTHGFHDTASNTSRITPTVAGYYRLTGTVSIATGAITQTLAVIRKNGTNQDPAVVLRPDPASAASAVTVTVTLSANGSSDYFELFGQQNSAGALNTNVSAGFRCVFEAEYLRGL